MGAQSDITVQLLYCIAGGIRFLTPVQMNDTFTPHISRLKTHFALKIKVVPSVKSPNTPISTRELADPSEATHSSQTQIICFQMEQVHVLEQNFEESD